MKEQQMNLILASYKDTPVSFNDSGFLNATNIAKKFGKRVQHYLDSNRTKNYIKELKKFMCVKTAFQENQLVIIKKGAPESGGGTWLHPKLAIDFARFCSTEFAVWCDQQIDKILNGERDSQVLELIIDSQNETLKKMENILEKAMKNTVPEILSIFPTKKVEESDAKVMKNPIPEILSKFPQKKIEEANARNLKLQKMALKDELSRVKKELELEKIAKKPMEYPEYLTIKNLKTHKTWYQVAKDHSKRSPSCLAKEFNRFAKKHGYKD